MSTIPEDLLYTEQHEWVRVEAGRAVMGITGHAAEELGDLTYVELPSEGQTVTQGEPLGLVESVKAVSDIYAPASGEVVEVNERLADEPGLVNEAPYEEGWMCALNLADETELQKLLSAEEYAGLLEREEQGSK